MDIKDIAKDALTGAGYSKVAGFDLEQITDLHNRRSNIDLVSRRAKDMGIPLLVYPEDKLLLRLKDLPFLHRGEENKAPSWLSLTRAGVMIFRLGDDEKFRDWIQEGYAYSRVGHGGGFIAVNAYKVVSR